MSLMSLLTALQLLKIANEGGVKDVDVIPLLQIDGEGKVKDVNVEGNTIAPN